jgi:hypothetical protein
VSVLGAACEPHGLQPGAEISPKYIGQQLINGAVDGRRRNSEGAATRTKDHHSGDLSLRIDEGAALAAWMKGNVKPDQTVDCAAPTAMPSAARKGDDAERGERSTFVTSDRPGNLPRTKACLSSA